MVDLKTVREKHKNMALAWELDISFANQWGDLFDY